MVLSHLTDPSYLAHYEAQVLFLREYLTGAGVDVTRDGQIKVLHVTSLNRLDEDDQSTLECLEETIIVRKDIAYFCNSIHRQLNLLGDTQ